jgi:hypothetical protein
MEDEMGLQGKETLEALYYISTIPNFQMHVRNQNSHGV